MNKKIIERITELFMAKLSEKTNWGRNQVTTMYKDAVREALMEIIDN